MKLNVLLILSISSVVFCLQNDTTGGNVKRSIHHHHHHDKNIVKPIGKYEPYGYKQHGKSSMKNSEQFNEKSAMKMFMKHNKNKNLIKEDEVKINYNMKPNINDVDTKPRFENLQEMDSNYNKYSVDNEKVKIENSGKDSLDEISIMNLKSSFDPKNDNKIKEETLIFGEEKPINNNQATVEVSDQNNADNNLNPMIIISSEKSNKNIQFGISNTEDMNEDKEALSNVKSIDDNAQPMVEISYEQNFKVENSNKKNYVKLSEDISGQQFTNIQATVEISEQIQPIVEISGPQNFNEGKPLKQNENMNLKPTLRKLQRILSHAGEISQALHDLKDVLKIIKTTKQWKYPVFIDTQNKTMVEYKAI